MEKSTMYKLSAAFGAAAKEALSPEYGGRESYGLPRHNTVHFGR